MNNIKKMRHKIKEFNSYKKDELKGRLRLTTYLVLIPISLSSLIHFCNIKTLDHKDIILQSIGFGFMTILTWLSWWAFISEWKQNYYI